MYLVNEVSTVLSSPVYPLAILSLLIVIKVVYRLYLHPLAGIPGPKLTAITKLYETYWDLLVGDGGQFTARVRQMHEEYGPIVRINPHEVSINDPTYHEKVYAPAPAVRDKVPMVSNILGTTSGTFGTIDHFHHRKRRAASSAFFANRNVHKVDTLIRSHVEEFCQLMKSDMSKAWEMRVQFMALKLDIFFDWAFADQLRLQQEPKEAYGWDATMVAIATCAPYVKLLPWILPLAIQLPVKLVHFISPPLARILRINQRISKQANIYAKNPDLFTDQKDSPTSRPVTVFQTLLESHLPPSEKTVWRLSQEGSEMFAASGTTSRVMTTCTFHLLNRPSTLALLQEELDNVMPDPSILPDTKTLEHLPYMSAVIKESLRIASPIATRLPLVAHEPMFYEKWTIAPGTPISVNTRDVMHNPDIYPDPHTFKPERWLDPNTVEKLEHYLIPFNKGTRMCMGKEFAMSELQITVAAFFRRFDMELVDTIYERDVQVNRDCFLTEAKAHTRGVKVRVSGLRK